MNKSITELIRLELTLAIVRAKLALMPLDGSNTKHRPTRSMLAGSLKSSFAIESTFEVSKTTLIHA